MVLSKQIILLGSSGSRARSKLIEVVDNFLVAFYSSIARIRNNVGQVIGAGFLVYPDLVVTCAHVVSKAVDASNSDNLLLQKVSLDFPFNASLGQIYGEVVFLQDIQADDTGDIAVIKIPMGTHSFDQLHFATTYPPSLNEQIRVYRFPQGYDSGVWATGRCVSLVSIGWIQVEDQKITGHRITEGFSGAPVWSDDKQCILGMIVAEDRLSQAKTAFIIPIHSIASAYEPIKRIYRTAELDYLKHLQIRIGKLFEASKYYTPLRGTHGEAINRKLPDIPVLHQEFELLVSADGDQRVEIRKGQIVEDVTTAVYALKRVMILGEPGAGKTTTALTITHNLLSNAMIVEKKPLPIFLFLGEWVDPDLSFKSFIERKLAELSSNLDLQQLINQRRIAFIFDGLNEIPVNQRRYKFAQIRSYINDINAQYVTSQEETILPIVNHRVVAWALAAKELDPKKFDAWIMLSLITERLEELEPFLKQIKDQPTDPASYDDVQKEGVAPRENILPHDLALLNEIQEACSQVEEVNEDDNFLGLPRSLGRQWTPLIVVVTCRERDYTYNLELANIVINPLDPIRIMDFLHRYLGNDDGNKLFWLLAGQSSLDHYSRFTKLFGYEADSRFWQEKVLPNEWMKYGTDWWSDWLTQRDNPRNLLWLSRNPYILRLAVFLYEISGTLPQNRVQIFDRFVMVSLEREKNHEKSTLSNSTWDIETLEEKLSELAYYMQSQVVYSNQENPDRFTSDSAVTYIERSIARQYFNQHALSTLYNANILTQFEDGVRFSHQLLQEYFSAKHVKMDIERNENRLNAQQIWPQDTWWERKNWEETAILLVGLYNDDSTFAVQWLAKGNIEVAIQAVVYSDVHTPKSTLTDLYNTLINRLDSIVNEPVEAEAAIGRAFSMLLTKVNDNRLGVGSSNGLPEFDWIEIPGGTFIHVSINPNDRRHYKNIPTFYISRYPVTYSQFMPFIESGEFDDLRWWNGLEPEAEFDLYTESIKTKPIDGITSHMADAYCRWLSSKLGFRIRLPNVLEWEKAARGPTGNWYPWGNEFHQGFANLSGDPVSLSRNPTTKTGPSVVGLYSRGRSFYGVMDMLGNVSEWCESDQTRGRSWRDVHEHAYLLNEIRQPSTAGFRVVCNRPSTYKSS